MVESCQGDESVAARDQIVETYSLVSRIEWQDDFGERDAISARLAFLAWNHCRRFRSYSEANDWEAKSLRHCLVDDSIRNFLVLPMSTRSTMLNRRYLADPTVLLASCGALARDQSHLPGVVSLEGPKLYEWILANGVHTRLDDETIGHLLGRVALACTNALGFAGRSTDWTTWFRRALSRFRQNVGAAPWLAMLDFAYLSRLQFERSYSVVADNVPALVERFEKLSMRDKAARALFLQASNLKELGRSSEALAILQRVQEATTASGDEATLSIALIATAELYGAAGHFDDAMAVARAAAPLVSSSGYPWAQAYLQGVIGELMRDRREYSAAAFAYRAAVAKYSELGMDTFAAYTRVVLAETLLLANCDDGAIAELLKALPVIKRENLTREAAVALQLLNEAIRRGQPKADALRELREQLTKMKDRGQL